MTRYRFSRSRSRPESPAATVATGPSQRRILWILLPIVAAGAVIGWLVRGGGDSGPAGRTAAETAAPTRDVGPSGRWLGHGQKLPSAADVLGALRTGAHDLVHVDGHVVDAISREAVGDVEVVFSNDGGETSTQANDDGTYSIDVARGEYRAFVRGDHVISVGMAPFERLPAPPDPSTASAPDADLAPAITVSTPVRGVDLEVQRSGIVLGRVVDPDGRAIAGAIVRARTAPWRPVLGTDVAESAADGSFRLEVPAGYYALDAAHADYAGPAASGAEPPSVMVQSTVDTHVTLTLARGCIIEGRVARSDGSPASGALERAGEPDFYPAGPIGDDGTFRYTTVEDGPITIRAWPWKSPPTDPQTIQCRDGVRQQISFVVPDRRPDLTGTIADASGAVAPGAYIDVYGLTQGAMNQQERADAQGNWAVYALPAGDYAITAFVPGHGVASAHAHVPGPPIALKLSGTGSLSGSVDGLADGETFQLTIGGCLAEGAQVAMSPSTRMVAVDGGRYTVDNLPACHLIAQAKAPSRTTTVEIDVSPGGVATFDLDLTPPRAKTLHVTVIEADGHAVSGADVVVANADGTHGSTDVVVTDGAGTATVPAHVGDLVHVFLSDGQGHARSGEYQVSDAPGDSEDARITLDETPDF